MLIIEKNEGNLVSSAHRVAKFLLSVGLPHLILELSQNLCAAEVIISISVGLICLKCLKTAKVSKAFFPFIKSPSSVLC